MGNQCRLERRELARRLDDWWHATMRAATFTSEWVAAWQD